MRKQIAQQTKFALLAWLFLQNFNLTEIKGASASDPCYGRLNAEGKSTESAHFPAPDNAYRIRKIVLDAGHGGKDPGCKGAASKEKHNALAIVLKLGARIQAEFPEIQVIYTRDSDVFIELHERAAIANRNNADLFISVHCNSVSTSRIHGAETYVMGLHTADHNLEVAKRENASIFLEDNYEKKYDGYDPNSPEAHIFGSVWQSAYLEQSILLASLVQQFSNEIAGRENRGVKQAGFLVLRETAMPSVLIEAGYLTNRNEEAFIASEVGQNQMAEAIFEAFRAYKTQMEGHPVAAATATAPGTPPAAKPEPKNQQAAQLASYKTPPAGSKTQVSESQNAHMGDDMFADEIPMPVVPKSRVQGKFRIHLLSWPTRLDKNAGQLSLIGNIVEEQAEGNFHYYTGKFDTRTDAEKMLAEVTNLGFRTAKIVAHAQP